MTISNPRPWAAVACAPFAVLTAIAQAEGNRRFICEAGKREVNDYRTPSLRRLRACVIAFCAVLSILLGPIAPAQTSPPPPSCWVGSACYATVSVPIADAVPLFCQQYAEGHIHGNGHGGYIPCGTTGSNVLSCTVRHPGDAVIVDLQAQDVYGPSPGAIWSNWYQLNCGCQGNSVLTEGSCACPAGKVWVDGHSCVTLEVINPVLSPPKPCDCFGNPIYPLTGSKTEIVHTGIALAGVELVLTYDTRIKASAADPGFSDAPAFGALWKSSFHHKLVASSTNKTASVFRGDGNVLYFDGDGSGGFTAAGNIPFRLTSISGGYLLSDLATGTVEQFDTSGALQNIRTGSGAQLTFGLAGDGTLSSISSSEGRMVWFTYANNVVTKITGPDGQAVNVAYDANGNLTSLTWPDGKVRGFLYENANLPWALTGTTDENNSRYATFAYDDAGHAISTEHAGGVEHYAVSYGAPAAIVASESYDAARNVLVRTMQWRVADQISVTDPGGQTIALGSQAAGGIPVTTSRSQAAGSGCAASTRNQTYDGAGNVLSRDDFSGARTCFAYDSSNREIVRVEGLDRTAVCSAVLPDGASLPAGARKIATAWHPDLRLPVQVFQPGLITNNVYHGQPDPFNNNIPANCTTAPAMPNGKPMPLICKTVVQPLLANGSVDNAVPSQTDSYTYDSAGRVLTHTDPQNHATAYSYYSSSSFSGPAPNDPDYDRVAVLLHGNGSNGSTAVIDSSANGIWFTAAGNTKISTAQGKFGGASIAFDGSGAYLQSASSAVLALGAGDFTIEFWLYYVSSPQGYSMPVTLRSTGGDIYYDSNALSLSGQSRQANIWNGGGANIQIGAGNAMPTNSWHHIALVRSNGVFKYFFDGVQEGADVTSAKSFSGPYLVLGTNNGSAGMLNGYVDELRLTRGKARYTVNFTPPTQEFVGLIGSPTDIGHTVGDLQSVTNAGGQATQYTLYDPTGRVRQMVDPKGVVTDITYTPRGWVNTVTVTPPGGAARTTSYTYDGVGQLTQVSQPDGTTLSYSYDAAHRLVGVTDAQGNSISYTLDAAGNRIGEEVRDPTGTLQRSIGRSFDALNRLQQVTGAPR